MLERAVFLTAGSPVKHVDPNYESRFDDGSTYHNSCTSNELASKFVRDNDNHLNVIMLGNDAVHEENYDLTEITEKRHEDKAPENNEIECSTNGEYDESECTRTPDTVMPEKNGTFEANSESFADKNVTQIKLQENAVCLEGSDCQVVKDICIDDGLHLQKKILETQVSENTTYGFTDATNANDDLSQQMADDFVPLEEDLKVTSVMDDDAEGQKEPWGLFKNEENLDESNKFTGCTSGKKTTLQQLFDLGELETEAQAMVPIYDKQDVDQMKIKQETVQEEHSMSLTCGSSITYEANMNSENLIDDVPNDNSENDNFSARNVPIDAAFSNQNGESTENSPIDQVEIIIPSDLKTAAVITSAAEENGAYTDDLQSANAHYYSVAKEKLPDAATTSYQSSLYYNSLGDLNFSGPGLSGPRITSGHIAYSGSISLRSDTGTTSSRSFAFPILQREWTTSPVKMAKADRRHSRRWTLFCCNHNNSPPC